jgi:Flp pilus assembly protein TadB
MYQRVPLPEVNFLSIMMAIQGQSGGNLSEPLGNLSKVVRDRKRMKAKIDAMSMEAKSSAAIIACLPVAVIILIYMSITGLYHASVHRAAGQPDAWWLRHSDAHRRAGDAQNDQLRLLA